MMYNLFISISLLYTVFYNFKESMSRNCFAIFFSRRYAKAKHGLLIDKHIREFRWHKMCLPAFKHIHTIHTVYNKHRLFSGKLHKQRTILIITILYG